jgi:hypothetical protein
MTWSPEESNSVPDLFEPESFLIPPMDTLLRRLFGARWGVVLVAAPERIRLEPVMNFLADYSIQLAFYSEFSADIGNFDDLERETNRIKTLKDLVNEADSALPAGEQTGEPGTTEPAHRHVPRNPEFIFVQDLDAKNIADAVQAALSGRLVIGGLRADGSFTALRRFRELVGSNHLVAAVLMGVVGLNSVRRICDECKTIVEYEMSNQDAFLLGVAQSKLRGCEGEGCEECDRTGFTGEILIHEVFEMSEKLRGGVLQDIPLRRLRIDAKREGMMTLLDAAWSLAEAGETTLDEVIRIADATDPGSGDDIGESMGES